MKIGILSDAHIGHKNALILSLKYAISNMIKNDVDIIVDCGDITDKNSINAEQAKALYNVFNNISVPYHIVRGNHDTLNGSTVASLLGVNNNIIVHNDVDNLKIGGLNFLFIPYTDNIKGLYEYLDSMLTDSADYIFSHLNITNNMYSSISFNEMKTLYKYGNLWFNGHIHTPEENHDLWGDFYNVGSLSSLTYGDEHIPCYYILDTDNQNDITKYNILSCIIHKTADVDFDFDSFAKQHEHYNINWRIKLPNSSFYVEERKKLKDKLQSLSNTNQIQFDYIKSEKIENKKKLNSVKENTNKQLSLMQQLFTQFEIDCGYKLDDNIRLKLQGR